MTSNTNISLQRLLEEKISTIELNSHSLLIIDRKKNAVKSTNTSPRILQYFCIPY